MISQTRETLDCITLNHEINTIINLGSKAVWFGLETGDIVCYNIETFEPLGSWLAHKSPLTALFAVDSNTVWSATDTGEIKVWKAIVRSFFLHFQHKHLFRNTNSHIAIIIIIIITIIIRSHHHHHHHHVPLSLTSHVITPNGFEINIWSYLLVVMMT
jgi:hypothetical protein